MAVGRRGSRRDGQPKVEVIDTASGLRRFCEELAQEDFVTVDTEFMREKTYWPRLCLIQLAGSRRAAVVDPLAPGMDLAPFFDLMADESVLKVFHAGRQDIEIIHHLAGIIPHPVFDTQIAAMVCGFGDQVGYESLVSRMTGRQIDKTSRFTDWSRRPLSREQLAYALSDVTHLRVIYERLKAELEASGRAEWLKEEMEALVDPATYAQPPEEAWKRVKFRPRNRRQLLALMALAAWREREAQSRDVPRRRILKDEALAELASQLPDTPEALAGMRLLPESVAKGPAGRAILKIIRRVLATPEDELPELPSRKPPLPEGTGPKADVLKLALKIVCENERIAPKLIASAQELEQIAAGARDLPALKGWRRQVFGEKALKLLAGEAVIGLKDGRAAILPAVTKA